jgi:hypothetical protein
VIAAVASATQRAVVGSDATPEHCHRLPRHP